MKKLTIATMLMPLLAACGGGGGSTGSSSTPASVSPPTSNVTTPPPSTVTTPPPTTQVVTAPAAPTSAMQLTAGAFNQGANSQNTVVKFTGAANLTLSGQLDGIWLSAAQAGGSVVVSGNLNTVVFMPGVDTSVSVTGTSNTFYLPVGSPIKLDGAGVASSTIKYYQP